MREEMIWLSSIGKQRTLLPNSSRGALCLFGAIAAVVIYGGLMNPVSALLYSQELSWPVLVSYYLTGFHVDCIHAAAAVFFLWVLAEPMLEKLDRIKTKYGLVE